MHGRMTAVIVRLLVWHSSRVHGSGQSGDVLSRIPMQEIAVAGKIGMEDFKLPDKRQKGTEVAENSPCFVHMGFELSTF